MIPKHTIHIQNIFKTNIKQKKLGNLTTNSDIKKKRLMQFTIVKKGVHMSQHAVHKNSNYIKIKINIDISKKI